VQGVHNRVVEHFERERKECAYTHSNVKSQNESCPGRHTRVIEHSEEGRSARSALSKHKECARNKEVSVSRSGGKSLSARRAQEIVKREEGHDP
jgi:hypothetical protein